MINNFDPVFEKKINDFLSDKYGAEVFKPGLCRTENIFKPLKETILTQNVKITTIAGTNGKGQTAHSFAFLLEKRKESFALWTSPHILSIRERFCFSLNGETSNVEYEVLIKEIQEADDYLNRKYPEIKISYYEFLFFVFLRLALSKKIVDHLILEVGLGGRLDAVNHFDADLVALTSISRDHQSILGNRYEQILNEKLGVCREGSHLISTIELDYLKDRISIFSKRKNISWKNLAHSNNYYENNIRLSKAAFEHYYPNDDHDVAFPVFKGRMENMSFMGKSLIFVGAHNTDGIRKMVELIYKNKLENNLSFKILLSFSKRPYEELNIMLKSLLSHKDLNYKILLTSFCHFKAVDKRVVELLYAQNFKINEGMLDFVEDWKKELLQSSNEKILICGSYYFIGEVQRYISSFS